MQVELTEAVWLDERGALTLVELAECSGLTEAELRDLVELGALAPLDPDARELNFGAATASWPRAPRAVCATISSSTRTGSRSRSRCSSACRSWKPR